MMLERLSSTARRQRNTFKLPNKYEQICRMEHINRRPYRTRSGIYDFVKNANYA